MTPEAGAPGSPVTLATARFLLRPPAARDAEAIHRLVNDWGVVRMLARLPFPYPRPLADEWIASTLAQADAGLAYHFVIVSKTSQDIPLGCVGLQVEAATRTGDLGYWIARRHWGEGVAREAAGRLSRWALARLELDRLTAQVATDNPASGAVLRRIGFREIGTGRQLFAARGGVQPTLLFEAGRADLPPEGGEAEPAATAAPQPSRVVLVAACALIDGDGRVLLARRPEGRAMAGLWEFPGGKMEPGEIPEQALIRELREELGIDVSHACLAPFSFASHGYRDFHLLMPLYLCRRWSNTPRGKEGQSLAWVRPDRLSDYPMPEADKPLVPMLRDYL